MDRRLPAEWRVAAALSSKLLICVSASLARRGLHGGCLAAAESPSDITVLRAQAGIPGGAGCMVKGAHAAEPSPLSPLSQALKAVSMMHTLWRSSPQRRNGSGLSLPQWAPRAAWLVTLRPPGHGELLLIEGLCRSPHHSCKPAISQR